jgi:DNA-binding NarL/FixJ family response regulator
MKRLFGSKDRHVEDSKVMATSMGYATETQGIAGVTHKEAGGTLLLVDDNPLQLEGLKQRIFDLWQDRWQIQSARSSGEALEQLRDMSANLPDLVSVDLGLPPDRDNPRIGLELLSKIHQDYGGLHLAVHSQLGVTPQTLHKILLIPASYIQIYDPHAVQTFATTLPLMAKGYVIYSPTPTADIPKALVVKPDPLDDEEWVVLRYLIKEPPLPYQEIADRLHDAGRPLTTSGAVQNRITTIVEKLNGKFIQVDVSEKTTPYKYRPHLKSFYEEYHDRYGR